MSVHNIYYIAVEEIDPSPRLSRFPSFSVLFFLEVSSIFSLLESVPYSKQGSKDTGCHAAQAVSDLLYADCGYEPATGWLFQDSILVRSLYFCVTNIRIPEAASWAKPWPRQSWLVYRNTSKPIFFMSYSSQTFLQRWGVRAGNVRVHRF